MSIGSDEAPADAEETLMRFEVEYRGLSADDVGAALEHVAKKLKGRHKVEVLGRGFGAIEFLKKELKTVEKGLDSDSRVKAYGLNLRPAKTP